MVGKHNQQFIQNLFQLGITFFNHILFIVSPECDVSINSIDYNPNWTTQKKKNVEVKKKYITLLPVNRKCVVRK